MVAKKDQHFVPRSYLAAWCDPETPKDREPYVHLFLRDGSGHRRKAPRNIFAMPDLYTGLGAAGERDLTVEDAFSILEGRFVAVRRRLLEGEDLADEDVSVLFTFAGAMMARTPPRIAHVRQFWERVQTVASSVRVVPGAKPLPTLGRTAGRGMRLADLAEVVRNPMGTWFPEAVKAHVDGLVQFYGVTILFNETGTPFVTSDNPAVQFDTHHDRRKMLFRGGLASPAVEVTLPASPTLALVFRHGPRPLHGYRFADAEDVFDINMRTILFASERFVVDRADAGFVATITEAVRRGPRASGS